jgi:hypothetical protein
VTTHVSEIGTNHTEAFICVTCGTQFAPSTDPPDACPICLDERQYRAGEGQQWTTIEALQVDHETRIEDVDPGLLGIGIEPSFALGQRALLVEGVLWDCIPLIDAAGVAAIEAHGGIRAIAISHPHYYSAMVEWARLFDAPILLHEADRQWIQRWDPRIELWSGERRSLSDGLDLIRAGGHFPGGTVCCWARGAGGRGVLLSGDIVQVVADHDWVSFMWSYPNLIPLPANEVNALAARIDRLAFDRLYGAWWDSTIESGAKSKVARSAGRYVDALARYRG